MDNFLPSGVAFDVSCNNFIAGFYNDRIQVVSSEYVNFRSHLRKPLFIPLNRAMLWFGINFPTQPTSPNIDPYAPELHTTNAGYPL